MPDGYDEESLRKKIADMWVGVDEMQLEAESPATPESFSVMPVFELETTTTTESNIAPTAISPTEKIQTTSTQPQPSQLNII